ncbi:MAG: hypothetical protein RLZZ605_207 [Bacteroidota bacterium]|jgi:uncharacterized PurR-regulated membrane protein YhhQ (DUF165 family)
MDSKLLYVVSYFLAVIIGITAATLFNLMHEIFNIHDYWAYLIIPITMFLGDLTGKVFSKLIHNP